MYRFAPPAEAEMQRALVGSSRAAWPASSVCSRDFRRSFSFISPFPRNLRFGNASFAHFNTELVRGR